MQDKKCLLIFELGHLQVFCYQTEDEFYKRLQPNEVFWNKKGEATIHGPFPTAYHAVENYSKSIEPKLALPGNVIPVDFKTKKRL